MNEETNKKLHRVDFKSASLPIFSEVFQLLTLPHWMKREKYTGVV